MYMTPLPISSDTAAGLQNLVEGTGAPGYGEDTPAGDDWMDRGIIAARWPTLGRAIGNYERSTAEQFSRMAYDAVERGIIRHDARKRLAAAAEALGIRPFDAQLLIACAIRQWSLDRHFDASPRPDAPKLSFEYQSWSRMWLRVGLLLGLAAALDAIFLCHWLG